MFRIVRVYCTPMEAIMLDEKAKYDYLVDLPEGEDIADATNNAMRLIGEAYPDLQGVLPKIIRSLTTDFLET